MNLFPKTWQKMNSFPKTWHLDGELLFTWYVWCASLWLVSSIIASPISEIILNKLQHISAKFGWCTFVFSYHLESPMCEVMVCSKMYAVLNSCFWYAIMGSHLNCHCKSQRSRTWPLSKNLHLNRSKCPPPFRYPSVAGIFNRTHVGENETQLLRN